MPDLNVPARGKQHLKLIHNSRELKYRSPFGAVTTGSSVRISIDAVDFTPEDVTLLLWRGENRTPEYIRMHQTACIEETRGGTYSAEITAPDERGLLWYTFGIELTDDYDQRRILWYGNNPERLGGEGWMYGEDEMSEHDVPAFQITVYREAAVPEWYKNGIVYQIFPGRFARDDDWRERCGEAVKRVNERRTDIKRVIQEDWNRRAYYVRDNEGRVTEWPVYGGSLRGIEEKLGYLKSLGVTAIYLNPVFESASTHHYDTADYMTIDPTLGTNEDFAHLAEEARAQGIRLILDGVFSHTGADSIYFNMFGNYKAEGKTLPHDAEGAWQSEDSPYRPWYKFDENEACGYSSWWGVTDLPEVNETNDDYRNFILGEDGVIEHWMKMGASGWRLDVADELPDSFIAETRSRIKKCDPDGLLIGEVWEDASNKISYGERRKYFMGDELDGTMNYPLRDILLDYINYTIGSGYAAERLESLSENYPRENFYGALNLIGSHDRERIMTAMAAEEDYQAAVKKVRVMSALEFTLPGVPCIYYGDEVGLTGGRDPENRSGYPWGYENLDLGYHYRMLGLIYDEHPVLKDGEFTMLSGREGISDDIFAFTRSYPEADERILVLASRSYGPVEVDLSGIEEAKCGYALDLLKSAKEIPVSEDGSLGTVTMDPLSVKIICLLDEAPEKVDLGRKAGVICHISTLGRGVLGTPAKKFADYIASAGMKVWQVLPLNPTGLGGSPYSSYAAFAGYPEMINRDELPDHSGYEQFCKDNKDWLTGYIAFTVLKEINGGKAWYEWPDEHKFGDPDKMIEELSAEYGARIEELAKDQYYFFVQWNDLREYANSLGIEMMGDLPMYMASDSADVWAAKGEFGLDEDGRKKVHSGVPPDAFSKDGQDWGNPLYNWDVMKDEGYSWWMRRLKQCAERFDILRIDHFRGFSEYYAIPEGATPKEGSWQHSAGLEFFKAVKKMLKEEGLGMKLLAEDLGFLDDGVLSLLKLTGLPGMDIWQFTADEMLAMDPEKAAHRAFYTGTHDNNTLMGFLLGDEEDTDSVSDEKRTEAEIEALNIIRQIYESPAALAMVQLQDMFMLGSETRINVPGVAEGNWSWRTPADSVEESFEDTAERAAWFRELAEKTGRI